MVRINIKVDEEKLARSMKRAPRRLAREMSTAFDRHGFAFTSFARKELFNGRPGLIGRRGQLARSIGHDSTRADTLNRVRTRVFAGGKIAPYARIQEEGGTVKPTRARFLTIPLPDNLTAGGVPRYKSARALFDDPSKDVFTLWANGRGVIGLRERGMIKWLWVLKKSVYIPPRFGFVRAFNSDEMRRDRQRRFDRAIRNAMKTGDTGGRG